MRAFKLVLVFSDRVPSPAYPSSVLPGGHVLLDVLRGSVLAHSTRRHVRHRGQGHAHPLPHRMGCARRTRRTLRCSTLVSERGETAVCSISIFTNIRSNTFRTCSWFFWSNN